MTIEVGLRPDIALLEFENTSVLDAELANQVVNLLSRAINESGAASLVVSGGRTPIGFFNLLSQQVLDWPKVVVTLTDERWVDADHNDSNEKLVRDNLLINEAHQAQFIGLKNSAPDAAEGELQSARAIETIGKFTVVTLGMGDDGHTASLFPGSRVLNLGLDIHSERTCLAVTPSGTAHQRMTLTLPRLLNSQQLIVHISGENKRRVLEQAYSGNNPLEFPIRAILGQTQTPFTIYWAK